MMYNPQLYNQQRFAKPRLNNFGGSFKEGWVNFISSKLGTSMHAIISFIEMLLTISFISHINFISPVQAYSLEPCIFVCILYTNAIELLFV